MTGITVNGGAVRAPVHRAVFKPDTVLNGTYRIVRPLGRGGMGDVFLAAHARLPGNFAIKALQADLASKPEAMARFKREAEIMAGIHHPNVVQVIDFNVAPEGPYLVMELVDGPDLGSELRGGRILAPGEVLAIVQQIASGLHAAHAAGVVHRDLKPENVLLMGLSGQASVVKVIDFGISISDSSPAITIDNQVMGTPEFMSPEQALGRREEIDARSDQFALAVLAQTLLARRPPFKGDTPMATLSAIIYGEPESMAAYVLWPASEVEQILRKGMARQRDDRYPSVLDFAEALTGALDRSGALATVAPQSQAVTAPAPLVKSEPTGTLQIPLHWSGPRKVLRVAVLTLLTLFASGIIAARIMYPVELRRGISIVETKVRDGWGRFMSR
ncbi:MAG TPA: serine/threonine-protein kinase [Polyangia bacterium]|jgi:serine/threonine-protein kinase